ncbi:esterase-like activity of phytase family protein [Uliginosibacterium paludis]|uniref:Esterase-like activity of phytase family protein n=1 Tax=Uliginosibacterium paludis TaxID=1615952 RepID=A0ABV2CQI3_9RHOO
MSHLPPPLRLLGLATLAALAGCALSPRAPDALDPLQGKAFEHVPLTHPVVASVDRYEVRLPARERLPYTGKFASAFGGSLPYAPGSGLSFNKTEADGSLLFWGIGDRGPNGDSPDVDVHGRRQASKVFLAPDFVPRIAEIRVRPGQQAEVVRSIPLNYGGTPASGLPLKPGQTGSTGEIALDDRLRPLPFSAVGIDPESLRTDRAGHFWIVDEYGPFLTEADARGNVLRQYAPGKGLPAILASRQPNRGFEGLAITPSGRLYAAVQSTLDVDGKTRNSARFIRLLELDPATGATRQFAWPVDFDHFARAGDEKLGDIVAIDDTRFAVIDQGMGRKGMRNAIYLIDIAAADDISALNTPAGKPLEYATAGELAGVRMLRPRPLVDLRELGWTAEKSEGLALIPGGFAVINDNDFGLSTKVSGSKGEKASAYTVRDGRLDNDGELSVVPNGEPTTLWLIRLRRPIAESFVK